VVVRCTRKLLALLHPARLVQETANPPRASDWYANLLWVERRKCLLVTHAGTLFSAFAPDVRSSQLRPFGEFVVPLIRQQLIIEGLPVDLFGSLDRLDVHLGKTASRSILGCMNDMVSYIESDVAISGGLARCDVTALNKALRRVIHQPTGYVPAIELASGHARPAGLG
jgi:hypothetical protein